MGRKRQLKDPQQFCAGRGVVRENRVHLLTPTSHLCTLVFTHTTTLLTQLLVPLCQTQRQVIRRVFYRRTMAPPSSINFENLRTRRYFQPVSFPGSLFYFPSLELAGFGHLSNSLYLSTVSPNTLPWSKHYSCDSAILGSPHTKEI